MIDYEEIKKLVKENDVIEFSKIVKEDKLSLSEIEWNLNSMDTDNTIELKDFLIEVADNIIGQYYRIKEEK